MKTVCITGPESCGKSELSLALADATGGLAVPEFARLYLDEHGPDYDEHVLLRIAQGQFQLEAAAIQQAKELVLLDTSFEVLKIWSEEVFDAVDPFIEQHFQSTVIDHYLLCYPDIPWTPDPLRENPHDRQRLFERYLDLLRRSGRGYSVITGLGDARLACALKALDGPGIKWV